MQIGDKHSTALGRVLSEPKKWLSWITSGDMVNMAESVGEGRLGLILQDLECGGEELVA